MIPAPDQLEMWRNLSCRARPGPWRSTEEPGRYGGIGRVFWDVDRPLFLGSELDAVTNVDDAHFIAAAREAVPALLEEVKRLRELLNVAADKITKIRRTSNE